MRVGITGHQRLQDSSKWLAVDEELRRRLTALPPPLVGVSSLAAGADQMFAEIVLELGGSLECIIPFSGYERVFTDEGARANYLRLLASAKRKVMLTPSESDEEAFWQAGRRVVEESDRVFAVWDGRPASGLGGTGDVVMYAKELGKTVVRIDPGQSA